MKSWKATDKDAGLKLVAFLKERLGDLYSSKKLKQAIEHNLCLVNGVVERFASYHVKLGDRIEFDEDGIEDIVPKAFKLERERILYEDKDFIFYDKPAGLTSDRIGLGSLFPRYHLVHRLDKETSGVILLAKSEKMKSAMVELFKEKQVSKIYLALVDGVVKPKSGIIENYLGNISKNVHQILWGVVESIKGRQAKTYWEVIKQGPKAALVQCKPITGRTHQIRVHMNELGHPILGDFQYAKKYRCSYHPKRCMLHASELSFSNPSNGQPLQVAAPLPDDFKIAAEKTLK